MDKSRIFAAAALCVALVSTGCAGWTIKFQQRIDCEREPYRCDSTHRREKDGAGPFSAIEIGVFDPAMLALDVSESNVAFVSNEVPYVVTVSRNGATTATAGFKAVRDGMRYVPADPVAVKAWLVQHAIDATRIEVDVNGMRYVDGAGANLVSLRSLYGGMELGGGTASWFRRDQRETL